MAFAVSDQVGASAASVTITLASLASSSTAGRQCTTITLIDGNNNVPQIVDFQVTLVLTTGSLSGDSAAYIWASRSFDNSTFEKGPPAPGASDAAFTFSTSPVGTNPAATDLLLLGVINFNAQSETHTKILRMYAPPEYVTLVVLNYSGIALASSGSSISYIKRYGDIR